MASDGQRLVLWWRLDLREGDAAGCARGRLHSTIRYSELDRTITDPFGVSRTYVHDRLGHAYELVPPDWRGAGYRHWRSPILDSTAETMFVQSRADLAKPSGPALLDSVQASAGRAVGVICFAAPADVDITTNVTAAEIAALHNALHTLNTGAVVRQAGTSQWATVSRR